MPGIIIGSTCKTRIPLKSLGSPLDPPLDPPLGTHILPPSTCIVLYTGVLTSRRPCAIYRARVSAPCTCTHPPTSHEHSSISPVSHFTTRNAHSLSKDCPCNITLASLLTRTRTARGWKVYRIENFAILTKQRPHLSYLEGGRGQGWAACRTWADQTQEQPGGYGPIQCRENNFLGN